MKKLSKLPERWVIKVTEENKPILQKIDWGSHTAGYNYTVTGYYGNECGGSYTIPYSTVEITTEDFRKFVLKETIELPEDYIVRCNNEEESNHVNDYYYHDTEISYWKYIVCKKEYINPGGTACGASITNYIGEYPEMPVFEYEEWNKLINKKEKTMKQYRITGSLALQKAFITELGLVYDGGGDDIEVDFSTYPILGNDSDGINNIVTSYIGVRDDSVVFDLPSQWDEAVKYVKEYITAPAKPTVEDLFVEVKAGDYVTICKGVGDWSDEMDKFVGKTVKVISTAPCDTYIQRIKFIDEGSNKWTWELKNKHYRKATEEEISKLKSVESFKLGEYECSVLKHSISIQSRGSLTFEDCVKLYKSVDQVRIGGYKITLNSINIGCVTNIPVEDIINAVEMLYNAGIINNLD